MFTIFLNMWLLDRKQLPTGELLGLICCFYLNCLLHPNKTIAHMQLLYRISTPTIKEDTVSCDCCFLSLISPRAIEKGHNIRLKNSGGPLKRHRVICIARKYIMNSRRALFIFVGHKFSNFARPSRCSARKPISRPLAPSSLFLGIRKLLRN